VQREWNSVGFLTVDEARTLAAICDHIIPPDQDQVPRGLEL
jgi:hypothetical protein